MIDVALEVITMQKKFHIDFSYIGESVYYGDTMLVQLGRLYCSPGEDIEKHAHIDWYELTIVTDGEGVIYTNDIPTTVKRGDIYLSHPGDFHQIISSAENPLRYDFFSFNTRNPEIRRELKRIVTSISSYDNRVFTNSQIGANVSLAVAELSYNQSYSHEILSCLFKETLYLILRNYKLPEEINDEEKNRNSADKLCLQIMHYIDTHIYTINNLTVLSEKFSYNYSYLSNLFKRCTGDTILNYYQTRRLDAAKLLLNEGKVKVNHVAEMLCYSSLYSFSKAFKNKFGISPKHYATKMAQEAKKQNNK